MRKRSFGSLGIRTFTGSRGFTVIELIVALTVLGIVASIAMPVVIKFKIHAARSEAEVNLRYGFHLIQTYKEDSGSLPGPFSYGVYQEIYIPWMHDYDPYNYDRGFVGASGNRLNGQSHDPACSHNPYGDQLGFKTHNCGSLRYLYSLRIGRDAISGTNRWSPPKSGHFTLRAVASRGEFLNEGRGLSVGERSCNTGYGAGYYSEARGINQVGRLAGLYADQPYRSSFDATTQCR